MIEKVEKLLADIRTSAASAPHFPKNIGDMDQGELSIAHVATYYAGLISYIDHVLVDILRQHENPPS